MVPNTNANLSLGVNVGGALSSYQNGRRVSQAIPVDSRDANLFPPNYGALVALPDPRDEEEEAMAVAALLREGDNRRPGGLIG